MESDYLAPHATTDETCVWLTTRTGERWTLARLLECHLMPWFWLDHSPGWHAVFGNRMEGYLAPVVFMGDTQRLAVDGREALVSMTRAHDGRLWTVEPGMRVPVSELRFLRDDVRALADAFRAPTAAGTTAPTAEPVPGVMADDTRPLEDWKMRVQAEAAAEWKRLRTLHCNPTRRSIRPHVLKWCHANNVKTDGNIIPSDGYLRTHVLSGGHWTPPAE